MLKKTSPISDKPLIEPNTEPGQQDQAKLTTELHRLGRRPFGIGVDGQPIAESNGKIISSAIRHMQELVGKRAAQNAPSNANSHHVAALVRQAQSDALNQLVTMLNEAVSEERYYVTPEYLLNESNNYTNEFDLFVADYCRLISGHPNFHFEVGASRIPASIATLARPLGIQRTYSLLPSFTAKFIRTDIRVIDTTTTSARVQWYADQQIEQIPEEHRLPYVRYACKGFQGAYAAIPVRIFNGQMAQVKEISCQANGDPCCEWEFTWQPSKKDSSGILLLMGTILVVSLLAYMLFGLSGQTWLALLVVSILSFVAWLWIEIRRLRRELDQRTALLQEQRDLSEEEYDKSERAHSELQQVNIALTNRVEELTMLQKVGEALGRTTDLNELLDKSLETVISSLHFDRALLMLIDEKRQVLTGTRTIGGDPQVSARAAQLEFPLDDLKYDLVKLSHADEPQHYRNVDQQGDEENNAIARGLGVTEWLGTPLIAKGRRVGVLGVDNGVSQRPLASENLSLLFTVGTQIAAAIDSAQLYQTLERRVEERTAALEQRNAELQIINSIQQGIASNLDFQAIVDLVGDKLREVFNTANLVINWYDDKANLRHFLYVYDHGKRLKLPPVESNPAARQKYFETRKPFVVNSAAEAKERKITPVPGSDSFGKSLLYAPIIGSQRTLGLIGLEDSERENAFGESEIRLVTTVAASLGTALENARLFDETQRLLKETEQRNAELAIINSVQEGLASKLDFQAIIELVGEKIREIFDAQVVTMPIYDLKTDLTHYPYSIEKGKRIQVDPHPLTKLAKNLIEKQQPMLLKGAEDYEAFGIDRIPGTEFVKSFLVVPLIFGDQVGGAITLQNLDREEAFSESHIRLLQTLASSLSVALENARLFDETQRLLKETEQRAAELTIINSVQEGLASKLDYQGIIELVGEKIREIFNVQSINIAKYDAAADLFSPLYAMERGTRLWFDPMSPGPLFRHIINTRESLRFNTIAEYNAINAITVPGTELTMSGIYAPLVQGKEFMGIIALENLDRENAFTDSDLRLLTTLANSMSVALENARLFDETQRLLKQTEQRAAELATINTVSNALAGELDLSALIELVGEQIRNVFSADIAYVALLDEETNTINFPYTYGEELTPIAYGDGLTSKIIETGKPLLINQDIDKRRKELGARQVGIQARSYLGVPIFLSGKAMGAVSVQSTTQEGVFMESDERLLGTIAANVGVAFQNARLFDEIQSRNREITKALEQQTATGEILRVIASSPTDIQPVLDVIAQNARKLCDASQSAVYRKDGQLVHEMAVSDLSADMLAATQELSLESYPVPLERNSTLSARAIIDGKVVHVPDMENEPDLPEVTQRYVKAQTIKSALFVPMLREGEAIGCIGVGKREPVPFTDQQIVLLQTFASQAVIAIENVRLFKELQKRNTEITEALEQQTATSEILSIIAENPTDVQPVLDAVAERAARLCTSYDAAIVRIEGDLYRIVAHWGPVPIPADNLNNGTPLNRDSVTGRAMVDRQTIHLHDLLAEPAGEYTLSKEFYQTSKQRTMLVTPLVRENEVIGSIMIRRQEVNPFTEKQISLLKIFADQAAIAIENVRLFNEVTRRKEYFEALFQNNPVAVVTIDNDATVTSWNPAAEKLFGYAREEAVGQNVDTLVAKTEEIYADAVQYSRIGLDAGSDAFQVIVKRTRKDGTIVDVELSSVPIIVQGEMQGIYALYHDITELQRARQEAIAANEAKSTFLATMSHEIRTPMNAVIGMSSLLMDTELNKEQRDYAETIRSSGDALLAIINDILDFSKIEAGKMDMEHQPFDLRECVESALDLTAAHAIEKGLDIAYLIDDDVPAGIKSDVTRLRQILINLLSNAIKFTEKGEVVLTVKNGKSKNELLFTVRDTGIGISKGHLNHLFQSFSQADSSTTRRFGGTGLGLAISKRLAEMMGGEMHAESEGDGKGSIFVFTIKAEPVEVPERKVERDVRSIQSVLEGKHVLIVDDNPTNRRILTLQTEKWGMIPHETQSPNQALEWVKGRERFDLAILDLQMPEMDGVMLAREIHQLRSEASLPIILLTSLGRREVGAEDLKFAAYLTKPLKPSHLYDALARVFARNVISPKEDAARHVVDADLGKRYPLRILLAEDNAVNQKLALRLLEQMGYRADVASNGIEAVKSIERQTYDVILMDVQMPEMDGLDATREIRKLINAIQPRIIAMTANAMEGDREMCLAAGMDDYISKPIRVNELVEALMKAERRQ